ncbi:MAG: hypothetical protein QOG47_3077, partial [Mycobacterium sp.]|nr:hypothetical protein [Mycobacterium sp.]
IPVLYRRATSLFSYAGVVEELVCIYCEFAGIVPAAHRT